MLFYLTAHRCSLFDTVIQSDQGYDYRGKGTAFWRLEFSTFLAPPPLLEVEVVLLSFPGASPPPLAEGGGAKCGWEWGAGGFRRVWG